MTGQFVWYELLTKDLDAAERFYGDVVGWKAEDSGMPGMRYDIMMMGGRRVAGMMAVGEGAGPGMSPGWKGVIGVPDLDAKTASLQAAGGTLHRGPDDIPGIGRFSLVSDPQGAVFSLFQPSSGDHEAVPAMTPGHIGWHELYATDWEKALAFYSGEYGFEPDNTLDMGPMGKYQLFRKPGAPAGTTIGGIMNLPPHLKTPMWGFYFVVPETDAALERIKAGGGTVLMGPQEVPGGAWIVQAHDPQGNIFSVVGPKR